MSMAAFKNFSADRMDLDELVALSAFGKSLRAEYEALQLEEPEFVAVQINTLKREIRSRVADKLEARKRELANRIDSLKTPKEKKAELEAELAKLEKQLVGA
jgi:DNA repair ATPase RecN